MDRLLSLLLEVYDNAVPGYGTNEELGLVAVLSIANKGGGDAALRNLRKRRTIVGRAFKFLVASTTTLGVTRLGMRRAVLGDFAYLLLLSRLQVTQPAASTPTHPPAAILPSVATPPSRKFVLGKNGRGSDANAETDCTGDDGGMVHAQTSGLPKDLDIPKLVS